MAFIAKRLQAALQAFRNPVTAVKSYSSTNGISDMLYGYGGLTSPNRDLTFTEQGAATAFDIIVEVQRGVMFIADSIAMLPAGIYDSRTKKLLMPLDTRELNIYEPGATFILAMREYETRWMHNFIESIIFSDWLYGETFVKRLTNLAGGIAGLRWLNPLWVEPMIQQGKIHYYQYYPPNMQPDDERQILPQQMAFRIHHRNSQEDLRGLSPVLSALNSMNIERNAERGIMSYFRNGMILGGMMMPDNENTVLSDPQIQRLKTDMRQHHSGVDNAFRWVLAPTKMATIAFDQPDLEKNYTVVKEASKKIMMALGVPPELAGNPDSVSYDNADKIMTNWLKVNGKAYATKLATFINTSLLCYFEPGEAVYFGFDFTAIDRQDAALTQSDFTAGIIPINIAQAERGYEVDETLKDIFILGGKPISKTVLLQLANDPAAFTNVTPAPLSLHMPGQPALPAAPTIPALPAPEPQKGAMSATVLLSLAHHPELTEQLQRVKSLMGEGIQTVDPASLHVTVLHIPALDEPQLQQLHQAVRETDVPDMALKIGSLASFNTAPGQHSLHFRVKRNNDLLDMHQELVDTCKALNIPVSSFSEANYQPHITIGHSPEHVSVIPYHPKLTVKPVEAVLSKKAGDKRETVWSSRQDMPPEEPVKAITYTAETITFPAESVTVDHDGHTHDLPVVSRDYSPAAALQELKAWAAFSAKKRARPFEFTMLRGDPADEIDTRLKAGDSPDAIFAALKARFDGSGLKALETAALKLFRFVATTPPVREDTDTVMKSIGDLESDFISRFDNMLKDFRAEKPRNPDKAANILSFLNQNFIRSAYIEGLQAGGVGDEPDDEGNVEIRSLVSDANAYVSSFIGTLYDEGISDAQAAGKAAAWWNKAILKAYYAGFASAKANAMMTFTGTDGQESCSTCQQLKGKSARLKWWKTNKLIPRVDTDSYECGGWLCQHFLQEVTGKASGNW